MKATRRNPLKGARENIPFAAFFTLIVTGPATLIAGIILIAVAHSATRSSVVFVSIFAAAILGMFWWSRRRAAPIQGQHITVHAFVSHARMHPELLKGRTQFDLERFRKQRDGSSQMTLKAWIKQFSGETTTIS